MRSGAGRPGADKAKFSATVRAGSSRSSLCDRYATRPSARVISPEVGATSPLTMRSNVDFPTPFGPVNAIRSGPRMARSIPESAKIA